MDPIAKPDLTEAIDRLWTRFLPDIKERVAVLESAAAALAVQPLTEQQVEEANSAAHKLAGSLGSFSLTRGTVLARELELIYSGGDGPAQELAPRLASTAAELRSIVENRNH